MNGATPSQTRTHRSQSIRPAWSHCRSTRTWVAPIPQPPFSDGRRAVSPFRRCATRSGGATRPPPSSTPTGVQFRSRAIVRTLVANNGLVGSICRVGACRDNAATSPSSLCWRNVLNRQRWDTREGLRLAIVIWIERTYHRRRRQRRLGRLTPNRVRTDPRPARNRGLITTPPRSTKPGGRPGGWSVGVVRHIPVSSPARSFGCANRRDRRAEKPSSRAAAPCTPVGPVGWGALAAWCGVSRSTPDRLPAP